MGILLRVEAVNLGKFLGDTDDLSTIRGSSLVLAETVLAVGKALERHIKDVRPVSQGGSLGLFFLELPDRDAEAVRGEVQGWLDGEPPNDAGEKERKLWKLAPHASFQVNAMACSEDEFLETADRLLLRQRWQQMQAPRLRPAEPEADEQEVCDADGVSPGRERDSRKATLKFLSRHVHERRRFGIERKHGLYRAFLERERQELAAEAEALGLDLAPPAALPEHFARDMDELMQPGGYGPLSGKIAVIFADGNGFGALQQALVAGKPLPGGARLEPPAELGKCDAAERQRWFDRRLRALRADLLRALLEALLDAEHRESALFMAPEDDEDDPEGRQGPRRKDDRVLRLETQLWAGDEMIWVLPAGLAFPVLQLFLETTATWKLADRRLTHAVGLVLCHHDAPISRIRRLAKDLAGHGKALLRADPECALLGGVENPGEEDLIAYEVLESFDHLGGEVERYRESRRRALGCQPWDLVLTPARWQTLLALAPALRAERGGLPQRQLKRLAERLHAGGPADPLLDTTEKRLAEEHPELWEKLEEARHRFGPALWLHLDALWDYLPGEAGTAESATTESAITPGEEQVS